MLLSLLGQNTLLGACAFDDITTINYMVTKTNLLPWQWLTWDPKKKHHHQHYYSYHLPVWMTSKHFPKWITASSNMDDKVWRSMTLNWLQFGHKLYCIQGVWSDVFHPLLLFFEKAELLGSKPTPMLYFSLCPAVCFGCSLRLKWQVKFVGGSQTSLRLNTDELTARFPW